MCLTKIRKTSIVISFVIVVQRAESNHLEENNSLKEENISLKEENVLLKEENKNLKVCTFFFLQE